MASTFELFKGRPGAGHSPTSRLASTDLTKKQKGSSGNPEEQQADAASSPREIPVWFQLFLGEQQMIGQATKVRINKDADVDDLRDAIKQKCRNRLDGIDSFEIKVYRKDKNPMDPGNTVPQDTSSHNPLFVVAPATTTTVQTTTAALTLPTVVAEPKCENYDRYRKPNKYLKRL